jgi:hypothetical protein
VGIAVVGLVLVMLMFTSVSMRRRVAKGSTGQL